MIGLSRMVARRPRGIPNGYYYLAPCEGVGTPVDPERPVGSDNLHTSWADLRELGGTSFAYSVNGISQTPISVPSGRYGLLYSPLLLTDARLTLCSMAHKLGRGWLLHTGSVLGKVRRE